MKKFIRHYIFYLAIILAIGGILYRYLLPGTGPFRKNTIQVGILLSQTGTMAESSRPVLKATLMAIDEINAKGGIDNRLMIPVIYDPASNWKKYAQMAEKMITTDKVRVIFGCWSSASRKEVKPIVEKYNNLLIYPVQYEGAEASNNIIYLGATPNQFIVPAVSWAFAHHHRAYLIGTDFLFPHIANEILAHEIKSLGGEVVGVNYVPVGSTTMDQEIQDIIQQKPDIIFNTITGDSNIIFYKRLSELTHNTQRPPVMSFRLTMAEMNKIGSTNMIGDYSVWAYFNSKKSPENDSFLNAYRKKYGSIADVGDPAMTAYVGVQLWAQAVHEAQSANPTVVREAMLRESIASPAGIIYIDPNNAHAWRTVMISKIDKQGAMNIRWSSQNPIQPTVYPEFKTPTQWDLFEYQLYIKWNKSWDNVNASNKDEELPD